MLGKWCQVPWKLLMPKLKGDNIANCEEVISKIEQALAGIAKAAATK